MDIDLDKLNVAAMKKIILDQIHSKEKVVIDKDDKDKKRDDLDQ